MWRVRACQARTGGAYAIDDGPKVDHFNKAVIDLSTQRFSERRE